MNHSSLPMRDINKLQPKSKIDRAWAVNNSVRMINEPRSTEELKDRDIKKFDVKYEKQISHKMLRTIAHTFLSNKELSY